MTLRLHHSPMACSMASRFALAETGLEHEVVVVNTRKGEQNSEAYRAINPRGKVPALQTDDGVLTESTAILPWIADLAPDASLMPPSGTFERARAQSWLSFLSSTVHAAYTPSMFPERIGGEACAGPVRDANLAILTKALSELDAHMDGREWMLDSLSVCDLYLLVFLLWRRNPAVGSALPALPNLDALQQRLLARPALAAVLGDEMQRMAGG